MESIREVIFICDHRLKPFKTIYGEVAQAAYQKCGTS